MQCALCHREMAYVHGHAACVAANCPMFGVNQAECCDGEVAANVLAPTADVARGPAPLPAPGVHEDDGDEHSGR